MFIRLLVCLLPLSALGCDLPHINGITGKARHNIAVSLHALKPSLCAAEISQPSKQRLIEQSIINALKPFGYFHPTLTWATTTPWQLSITPGKPLKLTQSTLTITGPGQSKLAELKQYPLLPPGSPLDIPRFRKIKQTLLTAAQARGYQQARVNESYLTLHPEKNQGQAHFVLASGPRVYFGRITWNKTPLAHSFIQRFISIKKDTPFSLKTVDSLQDSLASYGYFSRVQATPNLTPKKRVPVHFTLTPAAPHHYLLGMGYDSDNGIQVLGGIKWRYLNPFGHQLKLSARIGSNDSRLALNYLIPIFDPTRDKLSIETAAQSKTVGNVDTRSLDISSHFWHETAHERYHLALIHQREHSYPLNQPGQITHSLHPELEWIYSRKNLVSKRPWSTRLRALFRISSQHFLSSLSFSQWVVSGDLHLNEQKPWQLWLHTTLGDTQVSQLDALPQSLKFFAGGAQTLRGYAFESIGPNRTIELASISLLRALQPHWYGTVFIDAGNVANHFTHHIKKSAGIGLVWQFPMGSARLSLGHPIHDHGSWRIHLSFIQS